ncbi:MAG TPA: M20/M25/M40 family metallo-hydrolase [Chloroflexota bacterium]|nr:M20/M25/M40 family metallo-hydrolase [Chloroflexota bacterium]
MESSRLRTESERLWEAEILPTIEDYIRIPNKSPAYDANWRPNMDRAVALLRGWCEARPIPGLKVSVESWEGHTPVLLLDVPDSDGSGAGDTALFYGHLDKQPEFTGWREGLEPWKPVREGSRLYGRGGADDGYSAFAALAAIEALQKAGGRHARCLALIEASEESGSPDLEHYLAALAGIIGKPSLVLALDSGCANYQQLWASTSLRGLVTGTLRVEVMSEGKHSGAAGGIVPSSFRIARQVLSRLEDPATGEIVLPELQAPIPEVRRQEVAQLVANLGEHAVEGFPTVPGLRLLGDDLQERILNNTWRACLEVTGIDGAPATKDAGNVLRPFTALRLAMRLPPTCKPEAAASAMKAALEHDPHHGARVTFEIDQAAEGWNAAPNPPWLAAALDEGSRLAFGKPAGFMGEGGTIPFLTMLSQRYPGVQILALGVLGPESNAHGPNEFLDLEMAKGLTTAVAFMLDAHARRPSRTGSS